MSDRVATVRNLLSNRGFSRDTTELMVQDIRKSSSTVYNNQWTLFVKWCETQGLNPLDVHIARLADYLTSLFKRGLAPATIRVHRASISSVLRLTRTISPEEDEFIRKLIRAMGLQRPRTFKSAPAWHLGVVLRQLKQTLFIFLI